MNSIKNLQLRLTKWFEVQKTTIPYLNAAMLTIEQPEDLILANFTPSVTFLYNSVLKNLIDIESLSAITLANGKPGSDIENSFDHNFISNLFDNVFKTESILSTA